jgi:hypothetical protein
VIGLAILAAVFICYSLVAARLDRWSITAPIVFVLTGLTLGLAAPEWLEAVGDPETVKLIAELTLALLLFADASTLRWSQIREDGGLPARLLLIGFPLTVLAGVGVGTLLVPAASLAAAALAASILAPTDAALGLGIFTNPSVPKRVRRALNVESGLNDGMATPLVTLFLALLVAQEGVGPDAGSPNRSRNWVSPGWSHWWSDSPEAGSLPPPTPGAGRHTSPTDSQSSLWDCSHTRAPLPSAAMASSPPLPEESCSPLPPKAPFVLPSSSPKTSLCSLRSWSGPCSGRYSSHHS